MTFIHPASPEIALRTDELGSTCEWSTTAGLKRTSTPPVFLAVLIDRVGKHPNDYLLLPKSFKKTSTRTGWYRRPWLQRVATYSDHSYMKHNPQELGDGQTSLLRISCFAVAQNQGFPNKVSRGQKTSYCA